MHEQNNKVIKGVGGASQLLNRSDESALIRWETCGPDVARIVSEFEDLIADYSYSNTNSKHHEDTPTFREHFINDVKILYKSSVENPFEFKDLTMINNTEMVFSSEVIREVKSIEETGEVQFRNFLEERLITRKKKH